MSRLLVVLAGDQGHLDAVLADSVEVVDGQRCFRSDGDLVLQLPVQTRATVRELGRHDLPADGWDRLRDALRAETGSRPGFSSGPAVTKQDG